MLQGHHVTSEVTGQELDLRTATPGEISLFLHGEQGGDFWEREGTINKRIEWLASIAEDCFDAYFRTQLRAVIHRSVEHPDWIEVVSASSSVPQDAGTTERRQTVRSYNVNDSFGFRGVPGLQAFALPGERVLTIIHPFAISAEIGSESRFHAHLAEFQSLDAPPKLFVSDRAGLGSVNTNAQSFDNERKDDKSCEKHVELVEPAKNPAIGLEPAKKSFDLIAAAINPAVIFPLDQPLGIGGTTGR